MNSSNDVSEVKGTIQTAWEKSGNSIGAIIYYCTW